MPGFCGGGEREKCVLRRSSGMLPCDGSVRVSKNKSVAFSAREYLLKRHSMKTFLITLLGSVALTTGVWAAEQETNHMAPREVKAPGRPGYSQVADDDKAMDRAVEHAQRSLAFFMAALRAKKPGDAMFEIKKGYVDRDKVEHLWISHLTYDRKKFHGKINNRPLDVKNVRLGQRVTVAPGEVSDWMFLKNGKLIGGFTTRVLYARLSAKDKALFDKEAEFKIE